MSDALTHERIAGLETIHVHVAGSPRLAVVALHGYAMRANDLVPFAHSLGVPADLYFPEAPLAAETSGRAWWPIDQERRAEAMALGPRDLFREHPPGAALARQLLQALVAEVTSRHVGVPFVLIGFSQGGMLACDAVLRGAADVSALVLLSSSRISSSEWEPLAERLRGLRVLVSHGESDDDLGFHAGEALRDFCVRAGADTTWLPFAGGHGIPLVVWRGIRKFLRSLR